MVDQKDIDKLSTELENRLDDLFAENDIQLPDATEKDIKGHYPLAELKNLILSIDWEITDDVLDNLQQQLKDLQLTYQHDKIVATFLQILNSLTNYIKTHQAKAHPKTFKILNSVFASLDKVVLSRDMPEPLKKKILSAEMNRYKELRAQIAKSKGAKRTVKAQAVLDERPKAMEQSKEPALDLKEQATAPADQGDEEPILTLAEASEQTADVVADDILDAGIANKTPIELASLTDAVEEIKLFIHAEIAALKEEIQALRELK